jgi:hypothetical protein
MRRLAFLSTKDKGIEHMNRRRLLKFVASAVAGVLAGGAVDTMTTARAAHAALRTGWR